MACQFTVRFVPDSLTNYQDLLVVETQDHYSLLVPIEASRPPPILTLPSVLDFGYCLVGGVKFIEILCRNDGLSTGTFCILPLSQWPASNIRSVVNRRFAEEAPFGISPSLFKLQPGQTILMEMVFFPSKAERLSQAFTIVCDNCQVKDITLQGKGQLIGLEMVCVSGVPANHNVEFSITNPHSVQQKTINIRNNTHLELEFHWQILQPSLKPLLPGESPDSTNDLLSNDNVFHINPVSGLFTPLGDHEFLFTFSPKELLDYQTVCNLMMRAVLVLPDEIGEDDGAPQSHGPGPKVTDVIVMEIEVKGRTEAYQVLLEPYSIHIPGEMWNNSQSPMTFQWERITDCHIIEVEPPAGEIEVNECFDLEIVLTGGRPGVFESHLLCHIQHHHSPVALPVQVTFKGPHVSVNVGSVDLGLIRLGDQSHTTVVLTNTTPLEAPWSLAHGDGPHSHPTEITVEPCRGVLPPLASCSVNILFRPQACQHYTTIMELKVENGLGCHLSVEAVVISPQVCLLSCELVFSELYVGVPSLGTITMSNQTLLPAQFTWTKLQGQQASLCSARFTPSSGTLGAKAKMDITVAFTSDTDDDLKGVAALCEVTGMQHPLVLRLHSKAKRLNVSYSLPGDSLMTDVQGPDVSLVLDFGDNVLLKRAITKQLTITNHTAISAPFTLVAEYFVGQTPSPPAGQSQHRIVYKRKPLHSVPDKTGEDRAQEGFVNSLLADGRGIAFYIQPDCGILGAFETQTIDITAFTNMWGDYRDQLICKMGDLQPTLIPMRMTVRGCPIYFQMIGPQLDNQNQGPIIRFGCHVSGGDTISRSLRLNNSSPYDIRLDWESFNVDQQDRKLLDMVVSYGNAFPLKDTDGNEVVGKTLYSRSFPIWSHTPSTEGTPSSLRSQSQSDSGEDGPVTEEEVEEEEEGALYPAAPQRNPVSVIVRPHEGNPSDYPYCITPQQMVVPAGGNRLMHISFTPLVLSGLTLNSSCVAFALGIMSIDSKVASCIPDKVIRAQGLELEPLRLDLQASVRPAVLSLQMEEEEGILEFYAVASDLIDRNPHNKMAQKEFAITRTFQVKNNTEMPLSFRLSTKLPFSVLQPQAKCPPRTASTTSQSPTPGDHLGLQPQAKCPPRTASTTSQSPTPGDHLGLQPQAKCPPRTASTTSQSPTPGDHLGLQPQHIMQVKVAFLCSPVLLDHLKQPVALLPPNVSLMINESGARKLVFQESLSVEYSNSSIQTILLGAHLSIPTMHLSCDCLDFGTCYVGQTQVREVHLYNQGASASYWRALIDAADGNCIHTEEGTDTFTVTPDCGVLKPTECSTSSYREPLKISFTARSRGEVRARVTFQGVLGESPLFLHIQADGDETFVSLLPNT
ncbi:hypothetical protein DPEC_G00080540 [Dallia pectoralis]|uniref:Uncharacterized protein n=1 Tax=Dallia pectoralis TaxID=75939 RepID=A0ACC2H5D0_DALPE|nr:hypothetical protein DPEC_G00080540 [Dallia pectoralis]